MENYSKIGIARVIVVSGEKDRRSGSIIAAHQINGK
jgi:hypothetical protein